MTLEAALAELVVPIDRHEPDEVRRLMQANFAGELTTTSW
jgi:hypothetical protein